MTDLLEPLIAIGKHSCKIDAKSMAFIWKFLLKTLQQNPELCRSLDLSASVTFLVQEIHRLLDLLRQNPTNVSKLAKIAGFLIKVVVGLVEKDATILRGESENEAVLSLVLQLLRYLSMMSIVCFHYKEPLNGPLGTLPIWSNTTWP